MYITNIYFIKWYNSVLTLSKVGILRKYIGLFRNHKCIKVGIFVKIFSSYTYKPETNADWQIVRSLLRPCQLEVNLLLISYVIWPKLAFRHLINYLLCLEPYRSLQRSLWFFFITIHGDFFIRKRCLKITSALSLRAEGWPWNYT